MTETKTPNGNGRLMRHAIRADESAGAGTAPERVVITPPNIRIVRIRIVGIAPYLQCRFSQKAMAKIIENQAAGSQGNKRRNKAPRDFDADYEGSKHQMTDGRFGIPASAFRSAAISACRLVGYKMTIAKLSVFIEPDGFDTIDGTPLVFIEGEPEKHVMVGRNKDGGADIRVRAIWKQWAATITVRFDADQFSTSDVVNLFDRVGGQIGIGEGRPDSKDSAGMGMGLFRIDTEAKP